MRGEAAFAYRADTVRREKTTKSLAREAAAGLSPEDSALLGVLKKLRRELASERGVPAYVVFSDRSLQDMAQSRPRTRDQFAEVHGVGAAKLRDFADQFLAVIEAEAAPIA